MDTKQDIQLKCNHTTSLQLQELERNQNLTQGLDGFENKDNGRYSTGLKPIYSSR